MNIQKLKFYHFRNYDTASFSFEPECVHVLCGKNAQGKTNILEAIYFLSHLRSFRTRKLPSLIEHGEESFVLECELASKRKKEELRVVVFDKKKMLYRYGNPVSTASSFVGILNAILFCPDDLNLFSQSPSVRRQFMDIELIKLSKKYTYTLSHYNKLLKDRNLALKARKVNQVLLETYASQMADDQEILVEQRAGFLKLLEEKANEILPDLSDHQETLKIRYKSCVDPSKPVAVQLHKQYAATLERDLQMKNTSVGIHKDDVEFWLNDHMLTQTASQGQKRSVLLAIKLALAEIIHEKSGEYPILLLDDVFSELDALRRRQLIALLPKKMQVFITTAETVSPAWFDRPVKFYTVSHGKMKEGVFDV